MTLNLFVAGAPSSLRQLADSMREYSASVSEAAAGWHRARSESEADWEGTAAEAFRSTAIRDGRDTDALAALHDGLRQAVVLFADSIDTVRSRMEQAKQVAGEGHLAVLDAVIFPPGPKSCQSASDTVIPQASLDSSTQAAQQERAALQTRKQAAFTEAQAIVAEARRLETAAHDDLLAALRAIGTGLDAIGQRRAWAQAAAAAMTPAGMNLAHAAMIMDDHAANATKEMFETAMYGGPHAVRGMWASMTSAQQADLISRFPQMVGGTDGVPAVSRDQANRFLLAAERQELLAKLRDAEGAASATRGLPGARHSQHAGRAEELRQALHGLEAVGNQLAQPPEKYLLGIDATANGRGTAIIASRNPDTADHVLTSVPGTYSDLGDAMDYVERNDRLREAAERHADGGEVSAVTWANYNSPPDLPSASLGRFAEDAKGPLAQFQEGLRATHEGSPSHNTVLGHSYGSTVAGHAARDHGLSADEIAFIGSPGVGVDQAADLRVPQEHVWSGTSGEDVIDDLTPSLNPSDYADGEDDHWFGMNPSDPQFGGRTLSTDSTAGHSDYWDRQQSLDAMARVVAGREENSGRP